MANNGIFYTSGNTLDFTTTGTTWARLSSGGTFSSLGLSATTYYNLPFSGTVTGGGTTNYVPKWTGDTGLGNSQIFDDGTNVGIGTSSPSAKLDIITPSSSTIGLRVSGDSTADLFRITQTGSGNAIVVEDETNPDSTPFVVAADGRVAIGLTAPLSSYKLHVRNGTATSSAAAAGTVATFEGSGATYVTVLSPDASNAGITFGSGSDRFGAFAAWNYNNSQFSLNTDKTSGFITFSTGEQTERMRIDSSGNIGIGTTSPSAKVDINVSTGGTIGVRISGDSSSDMLRITQTGSGNAIVVEDSSNPDSTPFVVTSGGTIGIGTTSPQYFLEAVTTGGVDAVMLFDGGTGANANLAARADTTQKLPVVVMSDRNNAYGVNTSFYIGLDRSPSSQYAGRNDSIYVNNYTDKGHYFVTSNSSGTKAIKLSILGSGNVGIGTISPSEKLHVSGNTIISSGLTATTISATTYQNLPFSGTVTGSGTAKYLARWAGSSTLNPSDVYNDTNFIGLYAGVQTYSEKVTIDTGNLGLTMDGLYFIYTTNGSIGLGTGNDYSSWLGYGEIAIGTRGVLVNSTGSGNIGIGDKALASNNTGNNNIAIGGTGALFSNNSGNDNIALGVNSLNANDVGSDNIAIGSSSFESTVGNYNIGIGTGAGFTNSAGERNVYIGFNSGYNNEGANNIFIGYTAGYGETTSSNKLNIGETIYGDLSNKFIGINQPSPVTNLDVSGTARITSGLTASTVSATTYYNLPGSSSSNCYGTFYTSSISGCSPVTILTPLNATDGLNVTGTTNFTNGVNFSSGLTASTISASTYQNLPISGVTNGTGISTSTTNGLVTISNTQVQGITGKTDGSGISSSISNNVITITNTDLGSSQNIFKNIQIGGVTQFSAGSNSSNINFSGINITITSASTNTLVFSAGTGGGGSVTSVTAGTGLSGNSTTGAITLINNGVTQIIGTSGIGVSPSTGIGNVTLSYTGSTSGVDLGLVYTTGNNINFL